MAWCGRRSAAPKTTCRATSDTSVIMVMCRKNGQEWVKEILWHATKRTGVVAALLTMTHGKTFSLLFCRRVHADLVMFLHLSFKLTDVRPCGGPPRSNSNHVVRQRAQAHTGRHQQLTTNTSLYASNISRQLPAPNRSTAFFNVRSS